MGVSTSGNLTPPWCRIWWKVDVLNVGGVGPFPIYDLCKPNVRGNPWRLLLAGQN